MSTSVRLSLVGKKNQPIYRIVVAETRSKRNGKYIDNLGTFNPNVSPPLLLINQEKLDKWQKNGAIISTGLRKLLKQQLLQK